jgi:hypothetical protein
MNSAVRKPKFRIGQVVSVRSFYGDFSPGETGPGFAGKKGWRYGHQFGKIVKIVPRFAAKPESRQFCYFLDGWGSARPESYLRALGKRGAGL